jgi:PAS domain S-box-containing protein
MQVTMHFQSISYVWLLLASAAIMAMLEAYAWHHRTTPGAPPFALLMLLAVAWALANALEMAGTNLPTKLFWANVQYLGYVALPLAWLALALQYTGRQAWLTRRRLAWLSVEPLVTVVLAWTSNLHGLLRRNVRLDMSGPFPVIGKTFGPWFWVHAAYTYTLLAFTVYLLAGALRRPSSLYRRQTLVLLVGVLLPLIANALYNFGLSPIPRHDISPAVLCLSGAIVAWGLFRYRLFDIMPVARDTVLEGMDDGVIVLDMGERIVDLNQAAQRMLGQPAATAIGQPVDRAFSAWPDLLELSRDAAAQRCESALGVGAGQRQYSLRGLPLVDRSSRPVGRLLVLRDITDREQAEARLLEQGAALAALEERGRLARELHDGLGQVLGYVNVQTQATRELLASGRIVEADAFMERMAAVAQDAQADVRESILISGLTSHPDKTSCPPWSSAWRALSDTTGFARKWSCAMKPPRRSLSLALQCNCCVSSRRRSPTSESTPTPATCG